MNKMELLVDALEYMEKHLKDNIKTEDVAAACYCSRSTLEKLFRYVNHMSIREYLVRRRLTRAAHDIVCEPDTGILEIALRYGYGTNESFTRAFRGFWNCKPSEFRGARRFSELFPRLTGPLGEGDVTMTERKRVDISELYDLFQERRSCCFVLCDIKHMIAINEISHKAGDVAIVEALRRIQDAAGENDVVFRIGGDQFALLTDSEDKRYADSLAEMIKSSNERPFVWEEKEIPLTLHVGVTRFDGKRLGYDELFHQLHIAILDITKRNCSL
ncbi:MAG: helix-turn-helix domain-containing protein [Lachnospiraceae bacterium]|nr:helix-turn-helix domain-containing protein [Lachnospiraceae bacterium]